VGRNPRALSDEHREESKRGSSRDVVLRFDSLRSLNDRAGTGDTSPVVERRAQRGVETGFRLREVVLRFDLLRSLNDRGSGLEGWGFVCGVGDESDGCGWVVGVVAAGGSGPFEGAGSEVSYLPGGVVFDGVVSSAQVCEVLV